MAFDHSSSVVSVPGLPDHTHLAGALAPAVSRFGSGRFPVQGGGRAGAISSRAGDTPARKIDLHEEVRLSEVVGALSRALDLTGGQPVGHAARTCMIGMRIGSYLGMTQEHQSALYYALLLKDLGCSVNASRLTALFGADDRMLKHAYKLTNWSANKDAARYLFKHSFPGKTGIARAWHSLMLGTRVRESSKAMTSARCERGAEIAVMLSLPRGTAEAIRTIDEHWDGRGMPMGLSGSGIPMLGRIVSLAQTVEVFQHSFDVTTAYEMAHARRGRWFDPVLVDCLDAFKLDAGFWHSVRHTDGLAKVRALEPEECVITVDDERLDIIAEAFARVIDAKSPYTAQHSQNVARISVAAGEALGFEPKEMRTLRRAALLHDIGKLGVSNAILDKRSALTPEEVLEMQRHTRYTLEILQGVPRFRRFAALAASHHERLDGSGYHIGLDREALTPSMRILAVADVCDALSSERPYRSAMPMVDVAARLDELVAKGMLCPVAVEALSGWFRGSGSPRSTTAGILCSERVSLTS